MADDYIVIPSYDDGKNPPHNTAKDAERLDSAARNDAAKYSAKQVEGGAGDSGTGEGGKSSSKAGKRLRIEDIILLTASIFLPCMMVALICTDNRKEKEKGPQFQIHSASVSSFSISFWSETITADWNLSLGVKNLHGQKKFSYDFMQVSIFYGDTQLSTTTLTPFRQVALDQLVLNVNFQPRPAKVDKGVLYRINGGKILNNSIPIDVVIRAKISRDNGKTAAELKWSKSLVASCKNIELQFSSSNGEKAEMIAEEPVICEFRD